MALTADQATELASLKQALLLVRTGRLPKRIIYNGRETEFSQVDVADLKSRVAELELSAASPSRTRGAVRFRIGG